MAHMAKTDKNTQTTPTKNTTIRPIDKDEVDKVRKLHSDLQNLLVMLYERWLDESEYEDIKGYSVNIIPEVQKAGGTFIKMNKRPFGFDFELGKNIYRFYVNSRFYGFKHLEQKAD